MHLLVIARGQSALFGNVEPQSALFGDVEPQSALFRRMRLSSPGQTWRLLTEKRILQPAPHGKAHSPTGASRKSAFCADGLTEKRTLQPLLDRRRDQKRTLQPLLDRSVTEMCSLRPAPHEKHTLQPPDEPSYVFL